MTARTHDLAAITALGVVVISGPARTITVSTALIALVANQLGGIAPDIDQPTAPLWRNLPVGGWLGRIIDRLLGGHRFLTHSLIGAALLGWLSWLLLGLLHPIMPHVAINLVWWALMIGIGSHLVMDTFTKEGVPWLLPIPIKFGLPPLKDFRITTGSWVETLGVFPALLAFDLYYGLHHAATIAVLVHRYLK